MRLVVVSDTHCRHEQLGPLEGDVLIHCGDFSNGLLRDPRDVEQLDDWFGRQDFEAILCVGGNHDFVAEELVDFGEQVFSKAIWLQDAAIVLRGVTFYGAPWLPDLADWAFQLSSADLREKWSLIPEDTQVLITHTPPRGILDLPRSERAHTGCPHLLERVQAVQPRLHVFGHVHASGGVETRGPTTFVNAAVVDSRYRVTRPAVVLDLED